MAGNGDEINLSGRYLKLDTKAGVVAVGMLIGAVVWCRDTTNKLDNLTANVVAVTESLENTNERIDSLVSNSYTAADAAKDFLLRDKSIGELESKIKEIQADLKERPK